MAYRAVYQPYDGRVAASVVVDCDHRSCFIKQEIRTQITIFNIYGDHYVIVCHYSLMCVCSTFALCSLFCVAELVKNNYVNLDHFFFF